MIEFAMADLTAGQLNALVKKIGGKDKVLAILQGTAEILVTVVSLLTHITTVQVRDATKFVAKDHFTQANHIYVWDSFRQYFLGKVEENVADAILAMHRLEKQSLDALILKELGQERGEITLTHFFDLIKKQSKEGHLLVNGGANISYIRGTDGNLWAVYADWNSVRRDWRVDARSVEYSYGWRDGCQIISRA